MVDKDVLNADAARMLEDYQLTVRELLVLELSASGFERYGGEGDSLLTHRGVGVSVSVGVHGFGIYWPCSGIPAGESLGLVRLPLETPVAVVVDLVSGLVQSAMLYVVQGFGPAAGMGGSGEGG